MLENIYLCRHGFRSNWEDETIEADRSLPRSATRGLVQAEHLGAHLASADPKPDALFCSPFYRCLQTITPLAQKTGLPVHIEPGSGEWFSLTPPDAGLHARPKLPHELQPHVDIPLSDYTATLFPSRNGESIPDLRERCEVFLSAWIPRVEAEMPAVKTAVIMCHAGLVIALGRVLMNSESHDIASPTASVSLYRRKSLPPLAGHAEVPHVPSDDCWAGHGTGAHVGEWVQLSNGRTDFLPDGAQRAWTFRQVELKPDGSVIADPGDGRAYTEADLLPVGLAPGMEQYGKCGKVNGRL